MIVSNIMVKLTSIILIISLSLIAASYNSNVKIVAQFEKHPGNPAVSPDGRIFFSMQPYYLLRFKPF